MLKFTTETWIYIMFHQHDATFMQKFWTSYTYILCFPFLQKTHLWASWEKLLTHVSKQKDKPWLPHLMSANKMSSKCQNLWIMGRKALHKKLTFLSHNIEEDNTVSCNMNNQYSDGWLVSSLLSSKIQEIHRNPLRPSWFLKPPSLFGRWMDFLSEEMDLRIAVGKWSFL